MMQSYCEIIKQQREQEALLAAQREQELREQEQAAQEKEKPPQNSDFCQLIGEICGIKEFSGELAHIEPILPGIEEADFDLEEEIHLVENLLYDNSSPRPPEELNAEIADMILESLSPSPIPVKDSDSQMEEIDLFFATDGWMPPSIKYDDYDSEGNIHFLDELLSDDPLPLLENESSDFDHHDDPSFSRLPSEPPNVEVFFYFEPDTGVLTAKVVEDISKHHVLLPKV
nr:hypothetical protein [Tanacetum cinerariifolium]GEY05313.1 hypothetical protein [Tanacetum cinerariifolium]